MKKLMLILLLTVGMSLSFAAIALVMLFALNVVESLDEARDLLTGQMPGAETTTIQEDELEQVQDALLLLQQHKQEIEQDYEKLQEDHKKLKEEKESLEGDIGTLKGDAEKGQEGNAEARAERLKATQALYSAMRPADAAVILNALQDDKMILDILTGLDDRQAGRILSSLDEAKRNRLAPLLVEGITAQR